MALKSISRAFLRHERNRQLFSISHRVTNIFSQTECLLHPQVRFASNNAPPDVVIDCSGSACTTIKHGAICAPGTEEYCILGHMPGEEEYVERDRSVEMPIQHSENKNQTINADTIDESNAEETKSPVKPIFL